MIIKPCIISIPYEGGSYWRKGSKEGPEYLLKNMEKIREFSIRNKKSLKWSIDELKGSSLTFSPYDNEKALKKIEIEIINVLKSGRVPISLGGDHTITYPIIKAMKEFYKDKKFKILHFDAHSDTFSDIDGYKYHHGATFRNIIEENLVEANDILQFGIRGQVRSDSLAIIEETNIILVDIYELEKYKFNLSKFGVNKDDYYYISFDIDVIDPAFAPATGTPVPGGFTSREVLNIINQLEECRIIGLDIVELAPIYDLSNITSNLASNILYEFISNDNFYQIL